MVRRVVTVSKKTKLSWIPPSQVCEMLSAVLRKYGLHGSFSQYQAMYAFAKACGPWLSERVRAEKLHRGTLYVRVAHSTWSHEIESMKEGLLQRLHALPGGSLVRRLRFVVGPLGELPDWSEAEEKTGSLSVSPSSEEQAMWKVLQQVAEPNLYQQLVSLYLNTRERETTVDIPHE